MWRTGRSRKTDGTKDIDLTWFREHSAVCMTALSFLLPVFVMLVSYNASGIYPFGEDQFNYMDFYHLYQPFFQEFIWNIRNGNGFFYSWNAGLGTNLYLMYATNLSSPFFVGGLLFREEYLKCFLAYLTVFKTGLCGLTSYWFLVQRKADATRAMWFRQGVSLFFSLGYAMSGFLMAYNWNIMWLDCVILLPVILLGLERLVWEGRPFLYGIALAACIWCNFYLSIMVCLFLVLYLGYLLVTGEGIAGKRFRIVRDFTLFSLLAGGMAAALLLPTVFAFVTSDFGAGQTVESSKAYFTVLEAFSRHCMAVRPIHMHSHLPNIYCGAAVFLCVPIYAVNGKISLRRRIGMILFAGFLLLGFCLPALDLVWHGMNYPDGLPARQSFVYILLVIVMCHEAVLNLDFQNGAWRKRVAGAYLAAAAFLVLAGIFAKDSGVEVSDLILTAFFVTVYAGLIFLSCQAAAKRQEEKYGIFLFVAVAVMVLETQINAVETNVISSKWGKHMDPAVCRTLYERAAEGEQGIFRMEVFNREMLNEGVRGHYPSASVFTSAQNSAVRAFYERLGLRYNKVFYGFDGNTPLVAALFNVKYMVGEGMQYENTLYTPIGQEGEVCLYRVNARLPFGYVAPAGADADVASLAGLELQNDLAARLGAEEKLFEPCGTVREEGKVTFTAPADGIYYAVLTCDGTDQVTLSGVEGGKYGFNTTYLHRDSVIYLGGLSAGRQGGIAGVGTAANGDGEAASGDGETASGDGTLADGGETSEFTANVYRLNEEVLSQALEVLGRQHLENVTYDNTHINGSLHLEEAGRLILSVPYEKGWRVFLNGERVEPGIFGGALIALDLQPGDYELSMEYVPYGLEAGAAVSIVSIAAVAGLFWYRRRRQEAVRQRRTYFQNCQTNL